MASVPFKASRRADTGKGVARKLRATGQVPAIIYGHAREPQALQLEAHALTLLLEKHPYQSTVIALEVDGKTSNTLIREIQKHPFKKQILHVDFQELVAGEKVAVNIPLVIVGTSIGVRLNAGILTQVMSELACRVDPANIPSRIEVDVTNVNIGGSVHVSDLTIPEGVEVLADEGDTVLTVSAPKTSDEAPAAGEGSAAEPELIRKPKAEEEGEAKK